MTTQSVNNEAQTNDIATVVANNKNDIANNKTKIATVVTNNETKIALQLQFNYGANLVFGEYVFEPNKEVILTESEIKKLEKNSNFVHYLSKNIIKKYITMQ